MAHIKRRADCSHEQRLDPYNVIPMCLFGCDALFEKRLVTISADGYTQINNEAGTSDLRKLLAAVAHRRVPAEYWDKRREHTSGSMQASLTIPKADLSRTVSPRGPSPYRCVWTD